MSAFLPRVVELLLCLALSGCQSQDAAIPQVSELSERINDVFLLTRKATCRLAWETAVALGNPEAFRDGIYPEGRYRYYRGTVYFTPEDDGGCTVWASGVVPVDAALKAKIRILEHLDPFIKMTSWSSRFISQSYVLTKESVGVVYPFYDSVAYMPPLLDFNEAILPFYTAGPKHNPGRAPIWIEPYIDATGKGYTVSVSCPVYVGDTFEGVAGSDIPLLPLRKALLDGEKAGFMLLSGEMFPAASNAPAEALLSVRGLNEYYYLDEVKEDVHAADSYKLGNSPDPDVKALATRLGDVRDAESFTWSVAGRGLLLTACPIPETKWLLLRIVPVSASPRQD